MKKLLFFILMASALLLSACSTTATGIPTSNANNDLPVAAQLAVGTLKLAESGQDVTVEQAEDLVLYWQVYKELSQSETAAQAEIDGLLAQIQETMTDTQLQSISDMALTQQDVLTAMQGVAVVSSKSSDSTVSAPSSGNMPAGGSPDGGAPPDGGITMNMGSGAVPAMDQSQSSQSSIGSSGVAGVPSTLIDALIEALQQKIAA